MKKVVISVAAIAFVTTSAFAQDQDWWLVSGQPGDDSAQFIDANSVERNGATVSFDVATYWSNGSNMDRELTMNCNQRPATESYAELWTFACGSEETRMSSALKLGPTDPEWMAKTVFGMPS